jgi:Domain of unknown function (DUF5122) beta-propeller
VTTPVSSSPSGRTGRRLADTACWSGSVACSDGGPEDEGRSRRTLEKKISDSKIVTVGQSGDGSSEFTVARYDKDGLLDPGFGSGGLVLTAARIPASATAERW